MLRSDLCDFSDACIVVKGIVTVSADEDNPVDNPNYDQNKRGTKEVEIAARLNYLGNFWNSLIYH